MDFHNDFKIMLPVISILAMLFFNSYSNVNRHKAVPVDISNYKNVARDYKIPDSETVNINGAVWMTKNLNYRYGTSWCYDNLDTNCSIYGRLYSWSSAKNACPENWHLATREDWNRLARAVGGVRHFLASQIYEDSGYIYQDWRNVTQWLKTDTGWGCSGNDCEQPPNGDDAYGFSALPGGYVTSWPRHHEFDGLGELGVWWADNPGNQTHIYFRRISSNNRTLEEWFSDQYQPLSTVGYSVRCVMNETAPVIITNYRKKR